MKMMSYSDTAVRYISGYHLERHSDCVNNTYVYGAFADTVLDTFTAILWVSGIVLIYR